jgi:TorA maturation chaperone TorD
MKERAQRTRDLGLDEAIQAAGSVSELARKLGISQPSVSNWTRVPVERVLEVEAITGIDRRRLRPDIYREADIEPPGADPVATARAQEYALLSAVLARAPDAAFLSRLSNLRGDATPLGLAHVALAEAAGECRPEEVEREFFGLFVGLGRGELLPYGSYYLSGFLQEQPLVRLRADLAPLGIVRAENNCEPEDHAAILCEIMAGLIGGRLSAPEGTDQKIFERHIASWMPRFFADLEQAQTAKFYRKVGALGRMFLDIEAQAFALPA